MSFQTPSIWQSTSPVPVQADATIAPTTSVEGVHSPPSAGDSQTTTTPMPEATPRPIEPFLRDHQPPTFFELGRFATTAAKFLRELHLDGKLMPLLREASNQRRVIQKANQLGLTVTDDELQLAADQYRHQYGLSSVTDTNAWLERERLTAVDFEDSLKREVIRRKVRDQMTNGQVANYFDSNPSRYDRVRLRHLVTAEKDLAQAVLGVVAARRESIESCGSSLPNSSSSMSEKTRLVFRFQIPAESADAVFAARGGEVVGPIAIPPSHHLFQVEEVQSAKLDAVTVEQIRNDLFQDWLSGQAQDVQIEPELLDLL